MLRDKPDYLLRSPDSHKTPFPEILKQYNGFEPARNWMDLTPQMELYIENAYYQPGRPKRGLDGYVGTEAASYIVRSKSGLRLLSVRSMKQRPADQPPVEQLIARRQQKYRYYRFYFEIVFSQRSGTHGSVLLGADAPEKLHTLAAQLETDPSTVCGSGASHCTVFPEACSVSVEMQIVVNGAPRTVIWGSPVSSVAVHPHDIELLRLYAGRLTPVEINANDANALKLPLLPGDHIRWK